MASYLGLRRDSAFCKRLGLSDISVVLWGVICDVTSPLPNDQRVLSGLFRAVVGVNLSS